MAQGAYAPHTAQPAQDAAIRAILEQDPAWCAYALADLQPAYAPYCRWETAVGPEGAGLTLFFTALDPWVLFATGSAAAVDRVLAAVMVQADAPGAIYITAREAHLPSIAAYFDFPRGTIPMWRMVWDGELRPAAGKAEVVALTPADVPRIRALLRHGGPFTPDAFMPYQLDEGVFYGVVDAAGGDLVAVGGTHIVDWEAGIAAIGNMYTRTDRRGLGFAGGILQAILATLQARGVSNIVINVDQRNTGAQRLYARHGFAVHCGYLEGNGVRRAI
jgi:RimJ/RimL family protein N-acetyltransferase